MAGADVTGQDDRLLAIWREYGPQAQARQLVEEAYELAEAINEHRSGETASTDHIAEELADVQVMLDQVALAYGIRAEQVTGIYAAKVDRQLGRIDKPLHIERPAHRTASATGRRNGRRNGMRAEPTPYLPL